jgi:dipeptidyl aminopeptidase/acylaminoacyl peptidase
MAAAHRVLSYHAFFMRTLTIPLGLALLVFQARPANNFALTIDNIMRGPALVGFEPSQARWSADSERIYFQWKQATDKEDAPLDTYVVNRDGSGLRKLSDEETKLAPPGGGGFMGGGGGGGRGGGGEADTSKDKRLTVFARDGDLFISDNTAGQVRQITKTTDVEANPHFLPDGKRIYFTRSNNLYVMSLDTGLLVQVTDIRAAAAAGAAGPAAGAGSGRGGRGGAAAAAATTGEQRGTDSQEYLKKEQKELLEAVRERATLREEQDKKRQADNPRKPFTLQARQSVTALQLTPDEKYVMAAVMETGNAKNTVIPNYVTESGYTEDISGRSNVGDTQSTSRLAAIAVDTGEVKWVDHGQQKRDVQLGQPVWSEDGAKAVTVGRAADNKDRWIFALDPATGKTRVLANQHDDAWVDGPGAGTIGWMKNDREVYFQSEKTGYSHLYAVAWEGGEPRALTSGTWEVSGVRQSKDKSHFYLTASKDSPYEQHLYEMDADGGPLTRLTKEPGRHAATVSPDERWIADIYSYTNKPPELYVEENRPLAEARKLTNSPAPEFSQYPWLDVPIVTFAARDGVQVPARLFKPAGFKKGGPAVVFVHGSGYLQNVDRKWSTYFHEYMFHHILMERGFLVIDVDYRGSAGYGRDWRTAVYEHMGGKDLDDIVDAARYLVSQHGVDPKKIGLYGGSYGGFITLMAMFTQPEVFAAGAALRPVSDWALYNHGYTADILNVPQTDPEAYRKSSPIFFAQGLKGALLICHGMVDTNVEFQDTVRLVQKLIELRKENWQLAVYPVENHGFVEPASWADEYKRILALFEKNLK